MPTCSKRGYDVDLIDQWKLGFSREVDWDTLVQEHCGRKGSATRRLSTPVWVGVVVTVSMTCSGAVSCSPSTI